MLETMQKGPGTEQVHLAQLQTQSRTFLDPAAWVRPRVSSFTQGGPNCTNTGQKNCKLPEYNAPM